jgi:hypothetical protein
LHQQRYAMLVNRLRLWTRAYRYQIFNCLIFENKERRARRGPVLKRSSRTTVSPKTTIMRCCRMERKWGGTVKNIGSLL